MKAKFQIGDVIESGKFFHCVETATVRNTGVMSNNQVFLHIVYADGRTWNSADQNDWTLVMAANPETIAELDKMLHPGQPTAPTLSPSDRLELSANVLDQLARNVRSRERIEEEIRLGVERARREPFRVSWAAIGEALGVSGQAAGQKYGAK